MGSCWYRLYKASLLSTVLLGLPLVFLPGWYVWSVYAEFDRYRRGSGETAPLDTETFQLLLHDQIHRDWHRLWLPDRPANSSLPTFEVSLPRASLDELAANLGREGEDSYAKGYVRAYGAMHAADIRYRGQRHWHVLGPQKSMKIRLEQGDLINGARHFNLINDVTPFGLEEEIILDLARDQGLLTPDYYPVWVRLNNIDMGVYRYEGQPTEGLLRQGRRMPGSIYSGNMVGRAPQSGLGELFSDTRNWKKVASQSDEGQADFSELEGLLAAIGKYSHEEFRTFIHQQVDLDRFVDFDALDVVFGSDQHDYVSNHKLYFDPYRGRFEPIAWSFRGFAHEPDLNLTDQPLLLRLKLIPDYRWRRDRRVYALLQNAASVPSIRSRVDRRFTELLPDLQADPYWDAYKLLPRVSRFHRFLVRPMTTARWLIASQAELSGFAERSRFLLDELEGNHLRVRLERTDHRSVSLVAEVDGSGAYSWQRVTVGGNCAGAFRVLAETQVGQQHSPSGLELVAAGQLGSEQSIQKRRDWLAGVELVSRTERTEQRGTVRARASSRAYRYQIAFTGCQPSQLALEVDNLITAVSSRIQISVPSYSLATAEPAGLPITAARPADVPRLAAGESSPHPWLFSPQPEPSTLVLGPGPVEIARTTTFPSHQAVQILAGTRLRLAAGASLVFYGLLQARGTPDAPIYIEAAQPDQPFGGIVLHGPQTQGSTLAHVRISRASHPTGFAATYPGALNVHDTRQILLEDIELSDLGEAEDAVHVVYAEELRAREVTVRQASVDAVDLEFSTADLRGLHIVNPGDECLDLMGSTVRLSDSVLVGCKNNAISAGEETDLTVNTTLVADANTGLLAKNASRARVTRTIIYRSRVALHTNLRSVHYQEPSSIDGQDLTIVDCEQIKDAARGTRIEPGRVARALSDTQGLVGFREQVLGLPDWRHLDPLLKRLLAGGQS